uniref:Uncharacterized protein n=1 Tax=Picea sitchensis TaxID=3332 RepID=D5A7U5_PICSI|nr:unknown [Picea sitchensis]
MSILRSRLRIVEGQLLDNKARISHINVAGLIHFSS